MLDDRIILGLLDSAVVPPGELGLTGEGKKRSAKEASSLKDLQKAKSVGQKWACWVGNEEARVGRWATRGHAGFIVAMERLPPKQTPTDTVECQ